MSDEIVFTSRLADVPELRLTSHLVRRAYGRWPSVAIMGTSAALAAALLLALVALGFEAFAVIYGMLAAGLAIVASSVVGRRFQRRRIAAMLATPFRHEPMTIRIGPDGILRPNGRTPWRWITDVVEAEGHTLLLLSPAEFIPVPHDRLDGLTPVEARARIDRFRAGAGQATEVG